MLVPGQMAQLRGDIARLNAIAARPPRAIEAMLGYASGRLADGYLIALLAGDLHANQVRFAGLTLRSGGREGNPVSDPQADSKRTHVHDRMLEDYGAEAVGKLQQKLATDPRNLSGPERIAKVLPVIRHKGDDPAQEYPPGGGAGQWTLDVPHPFFIAVEVTPDGIAKTAAGWSVSVADGAPYDGRARLAGYLASVKPAP